MRLQQTARDNVFRIAKHEVGNWIMAERLGFQGGGIKITLLGLVEGHRGEAEITLQDTLRNIQDLESYVRRRIVVLFAGCLAESFSTEGKVDQQKAVDELEKKGAVNDFKAIRELLRVLRGIKYEPPSSGAEHCEQLRALQDELWARAIELVESDQEIIQGLAKSIASRATALKVPFGMDESELRSLQAVKTWVEKLSASRDCLDV